MRELAARPERLRGKVLAQPEGLPVVIDEVQKLPELLEVVHALIEERRATRFVLTGSSARKLRRGGVNLLGGRAVFRQMHPFMAAELGRKFKLEKALEIGMLPLAWASEQPSDTLMAYNGLYIREEVQAEGLVRNSGAFARFLEELSLSHARVLNVTNVARDCEVNAKTCEGYMQIVEDLLLGYRLPVFTKRAKRALAAHPKFFFFDTGVFRAVRPTGPLDTVSDLEGAALEGLVAQHLRAWCDYSPGRHGMYYWRTRSQVEVDLVIYGALGIFAFEVKNSARVRPEDIRGLKSFGEDYPQSRLFLLYRGKDRELLDDVLVLPVEEFLRALQPGSMPFCDLG